MFYNEKKNIIFQLQILESTQYLRYVEGMHQGYRIEFLYFLKFQVTRKNNYFIEFQVQLMHMKHVPLSL